MLIAARPCAPAPARPGLDRAAEGAGAVIRRQTVECGARFNGRTVPSDRIVL